MTMKQLGTAAALAALVFSTALAATDLNTTEVAALVAQGKILSGEKLNAAALAKHPGGVIEQGSEVEQHRRGYIYEVEITDANGAEWDMELDATTGAVLKNKRD